MAHTAQTTASHQTVMSWATIAASAMAASSACQTTRMRAPTAQSRCPQYQLPSLLQSVSSVRLQGSVVVSLAVGKSGEGDGITSSIFSYGSPLAEGRA